MKKKNEFNDYLENFSSIAENLKALLKVEETMKNHQSFAKDELLRSMKQELADNCSLEFLGQMKKEVSKVFKKLNLFGSGKKSNLDYLVEVIFISLTGSDSVIGLEHFIAPGENYEESAEFCNEFFRDFIIVKELFRVELRECSDVRVGYAMEFYKPK